MPVPVLTISFRFKPQTNSKLNSAHVYGENLCSEIYFEQVIFIQLDIPYSLLIKEKWFDIKFSINERYRKINFI